MKNLFIVSIISTFYLLSIVTTPKAFAENISQTMCRYVASDDKQRLRSYLKSNKLKIRSIFKDIECNGMNLIAFASSQNAKETGALIISKLPKKTVAELMSSITSTELNTLAKKRVNS